MPDARLFSSWKRWGEPVPIVVRAPSGGGLRAGPFHSQNPEAWFVHTPGLKVVAPATPYDAKGLLKAAIRDDNPVIYFENKYLYRHLKGQVPEEDYIVPIGVADVRRQGEDVTIFTYGAMLHEALAAAEEVAREGVTDQVAKAPVVQPEPAAPQVVEAEPQMAKTPVPEPVVDAVAEAAAGKPQQGWYGRVDHRAVRPLPPFIRDRRG